MYRLYKTYNFIFLFYIYHIFLTDVELPGRNAVNKSLLLLLLLLLLLRLKQ